MEHGGADGGGGVWNQSQNLSESDTDGGHTMLGYRHTDTDQLECLSLYPCHWHQFQLLNVTQDHIQLIRVEEYSVDIGL